MSVRDSALCRALLSQIVCALPGAGGDELEARCRGQGDNSTDVPRASNARPDQPLAPVRRADARLDVL